MFGFGLPKIGIDLHLNDRMSAGLTHAKRKLSDFGRSAGGLGKAAGMATSGLGMMGGSIMGIATAAGPAGLAIAATGGAVFLLGKSALNTASGFEASMNRVTAALSGADRAMTPQLKSLAMRLGGDTVFSASQAADAITVLGKAGWKAGSIMQGLPSVLDMAASSGLSIADAAGITSAAMNVFGKEASQAGNIADQLTKTAQSAHLEVYEIGETLKYAGPAASMAGVRFQQLNSMTAILAQNNIKASMAGTGLSAVFSKLSAPVGGAAAALKQLGIKTKDSKGNLRDVFDVFQDLNKATSKFGTADKGALFKKIFGDIGMRSAGILTKNISQIRELHGSLGNVNGLSKEIAGIKMGGYEGGLKNLSSSWERLMINIGETILPAATSTVNFLVGAVDLVNSGLEGFRYGIAKIETFFDRILPKSEAFRMAFNVLENSTGLGVLVDTDITADERKRNENIISAYESKPATVKGSNQSISSNTNNSRQTIIQGDFYAERDSAIVELFHAF